MDKSSCLVCRSSAVVERDIRYIDAYRVSCQRCTPVGYGFVITGTVTVVQGIPEEKGNLLSHWIRKQCKKNKEIVIDSYVLEHIIPNLRYPKPREQINYLIQWLGEECETPEKMITQPLLDLTSIIGANGQEGVLYISEHLQKIGLVRYKQYQDGDGLQIGLTFEGWQKYDELKNRGEILNRAFLAMQYNDKELEDFYRSNLKPAVEQTGFELYILSDVLKAGLIDNQIRVEIRNSRFLLADLTHGNQGAYWEAGYAEGLGKPVIYLYRKDQAKEIHFDTNHCTTIFWEQSDLEGSLRKLKATIRATLPSDAKMVDD